MSKKTYSSLAVICLVGLISGVLFDRDISEVLYRENNIVAVALSVLGIYMYYGSFVFFLGVLGRQLFSASNKMMIRCVIAIVYTCFSFSTSTYAAAALLSDSVCGLLIESNAHPFVRNIVAGLYIFWPLYPLGIIANGKRYDKKVICDLILLLSLMTIAICASNLVKYLVMRPRFRVTLEGYDGIGFVPVFRRFGEGRLLKKMHGLKSDDLASFFSGHAMNGILCTLLFPAYGYVFPKLQGKGRQLIAVALIFAIPISFSRIILGDHYLSDISFGSFVGLMFVVLYGRLRKNFRSLE